jgi:urease accessory protein
LHVGYVHGASAVLACRSGTPLSLLTPRSRGDSVWAYTSSFGGGMVAGDNIQIDVKVDPGATCFLGSQASNKIYRNPRGLPCTHRLSAWIGERSLLVLAPDPVQCFAEASYEQQQRFHLDPDANLVMVDWLSGGRLSRGERWSFNRYASRNEVFCTGRRVLLDAIDLDARTAPLTNRFGVGRFNCFATVLLLGPALSPFAGELLARIASEPIAPGATLLASASPLADGALLRVAGMSIEEVGHALYQNLHFVSTLLQDDPWLRKW